MSELWEYVPDFDCIYQVSNLGRIRRHPEAKAQGAVAGAVLTGGLRYGYPLVGLRKNGQSRSMIVHRIVAFVFCNPPPNYLQLQVNHKNGIKHDNRADNLEWVTALENVRHAIDVLKILKRFPKRDYRGEKSGRAKLTNEDVISIRAIYKSGSCTQAELAKRFNMAQSSISYIVSGQRWSHLS